MRHRFNYCKVHFDYDPVDYYYIPGLWRAPGNGCLTPVFFQRAVLNKYSTDPAYRLDLRARTSGNIEKPSEFAILFGINRSNNVIMWLGDIHELPESEQYYLKSYNVPSDHDLCSEFYAQQVEARFADMSPESELLFERSKLWQECINAKNTDLFLHAGEVSHVISNFSRPIFWTEKHLKPVFSAFNQIIAESINKDFLKKELKGYLHKDKMRGMSSLKLLENWIEKVPDVRNAKDITCPFFVLYDLRILCDHLLPSGDRQEKLQSVNRRLGLSPDNTDFEQIYNTLICHLAKSFRSIREALQNQASS